MTGRLEELSAAGVSIWLDDLSRERLDSGNLVELNQLLLKIIHATQGTKLDGFYE